MNKQILTTLLCPYHRLGYLGHYGAHLDKTMNNKTTEANKLVDEHNSKINSFETEEENVAFHKQIVSEIDKIFKQ